MLPERLVASSLNEDGDSSKDNNHWLHAGWPGRSRRSDFSNARCNSALSLDTERTFRPAFVAPPPPPRPEPNRDSSRGEGRSRPGLLLLRSPLAPLWLAP